MWINQETNRLHDILLTSSISARKKRWFTVGANKCLTHQKQCVVFMVIPDKPSQFPDGTQQHFSCSDHLEKKKNTSMWKRWQFWSCAQVTPTELQRYRHVDVEQLQIEIKHWPSVSSTPATLRQQVFGLRPRWPTKDSHVKPTSEQTALFQHACWRNWRNVCYVEKKRERKWNKNECQLWVNQCSWTPAGRLRDQREFSRGKRRETSNV